MPRKRRKYPAELKAKISARGAARRVDDVRVGRSWWPIVEVAQVRDDE